jgi:membrane protein implicated in regulation of membrane protease activity
VTFFYIVLLSIGLLYAIIILVGGELSHLHIPGIDLHLDHGGLDLGGEVKLPSLSPVSVSSFVTAFGAFGLVGEWLSSGSAVWSLGAATIGGFIVALIAHFAFGYFLLGPQGSSEVTMTDLIGAEAEVMTPIPGDSVGEIALVAQGGRITFPAKSATGQPIARNTTVAIERVVGGVAFVRPQ